MPISDLLSAFHAAQTAQSWGAHVPGLDLLQQASHEMTKASDFVKHLEDEGLGRECGRLCENFFEKIVPFSPCPVAVYRGSTTSKGHLHSSGTSHNSCIKKSSARKTRIDPRPGW